MRELAQLARSTCQWIAQYNDEQREQVTQFFSAAGVEVTSLLDDPLLASPQTHSFGLRINPQDVHKAIAIATEHGYLDVGLLRGSALHRYVQHHPSIRLIATDAMTTRMTLIWGQPSTKRRWYARLQPSSVDYSLVDLPNVFYPLYYLVKPLRLVFAPLLRRVGINLTPPHAYYLGTPDGLTSALLKAADITQTDKLVDLGCGDGRLLICAAQEVGCSAVGVERDAGLVALAREKVKAASLASIVDVVHGQFEDVDMSDATVVFLFLPVALLSQLVPDLLQQLQPGARIIAHEQQPFDLGIAPQIRVPVITNTGVTVASIWKV